MHACPSRAIDIDWETEIPDFVERIVEYACGAVKTKHGKAGYINFSIRITLDCDCFPFSVTSYRTGYRVSWSQDPVAIDTASFDLVNRLRASPIHCSRLITERGKISSKEFTRRLMESGSWSTQKISDWVQEITI